MGRVKALLVKAVFCVLFIYTFNWVRSNVYYMPRTSRKVFYPNNEAHVIFPDYASPIPEAQRRFIIPNTDLCPKDVTINHVVLVHSAVDNFDRRQRIRNTWANPKNFRGIQSRTVFVLGKPRFETVQSRVYAESSTFGDIIQGNFLDDYHNLTTKAVVGLKWISSYCSNSIGVIKVDDDVFVNIFKAVWEILPLVELQPRQLLCCVEPTAHIFRKPLFWNAEIIKWVIPEDYFPGLSYYPMPFCYGFGVIMSTQIVKELFELSKITPFYRLDDVYVYGILANQIKGLSWRTVCSVVSSDESDTLYKAHHILELNNLLIGTARSDDVMDDLWSHAKHFYTYLQKKSE